MPAWVSLPQQVHRSIIVRRTKYQTLWKGLYINCCGFFYAEDFDGKIGIILLFDLQIFFITMPQEVRKGGGTSMRASKGTWDKYFVKPVFWVFTACKQMKNRGTKCSFILVMVQPTVAQSSFHTEFLSSIRFSPLRLLWRRKRTRNSRAFSSGHEEELKLRLLKPKANYSNTTGSRTVRLNVSFVQLKWHCNSHYTWQLTGNFNRDDMNLSMHRRELMRFRNSFSLLS